MDSRRLVFACGVFVVIIVGVFFVVKTSQLPSNRTPLLTTSVKFIPTCGAITKECIAQKVVEECADKKKTAKQLEEELKDPFRTEVCALARDQLENECPSGCRLNYSSFTFVAGKVETAFRTKTDGTCLATAKRPVKIRAHCTPSE